MFPAAGSCVLPPDSSVDVWMQELPGSKGGIVHSVSERRICPVCHFTAGLLNVRISSSFEGLISQLLDWGFLHSFPALPETDLKK